MKKLTLDMADVRVASFETNDEPVTVNVVTGPWCITRPSGYNTCCSE